jgi:hypothetical protein
MYGTNDSNHTMTLDSTKTLDDQRWPGQKLKIFVSRQKSQRCLPGGGVMG